MNRNKRLLMRTWALLSFLSLLFISASIQAATVRYQHTDMLGSVVAESDASGNIISRSQYEPFGKRLGGDKEGIGYTGHLQDKDLGLTYMQARYYDPLIGRFYANDPMGFKDVHNFNRYAYGNNNPYRYTDPDGKAADVIFDAAFTVYDAGQTLGAAVAYVEGVVTGNEVLTAVAGEGLTSSATNLAMSAGSVLIPGVSAPVLRGAVAVGEGAAASSKTQKGLEILKNGEKNVTSKDTKTSFAQKLENRGFEKGTDSKGNINYTKGDVRYTLKHAKSGKDTAYRNDGEKQSHKIRLEDE